MIFGAVFMYFNAFPSIAKVTLIIIKANHTALPKYPKSLCRFSFVLMHFRQPIIEIIFLMIDRMVKRYFNKIGFGKNFLHFSSYVIVHSIIVAHMQKSSSYKIRPQVLHFLGIEYKPLNRTPHKVVSETIHSFRKGAPSPSRIAIQAIPTKPMPQKISTMLASRIFRLSNQSSVGTTKRNTAESSTIDGCGMGFVFV